MLFAHSSSFKVDGAGERRDNIKETGNLRPLVLARASSRTVHVGVGVGGQGKSFLRPGTVGNGKYMGGSKLQ